MTRVAVQMVEVIEQSRVAPPPGSVPETHLPLTLFDVLWLLLPPVQRIFFFDNSHYYSKSHFLTTQLPNLKKSLSLALQHYYPLAGTLALPSQTETGEHEIHYTVGDSIPLIVAESDSDFHELVSDGPKDTTGFHPLVPAELAASDLISFQVTVFPDSGFSIGLTVHHVACDGTGVVQFMKHWASICRFGRDDSLLPFHDRTLVLDPNGLKRIFSAQISLMDQAVNKADFRKPQVHMVRATFTLTRADIDELRHRVEQKARNAPVHLSSFVLTCGHVWACLTKVRADVAGEGLVHFGFAVDCRARMDPPIPAAYFGNCIGSGFASAKGSDVAGGEDSGLAAACEAISREIRRLDDVEQFLKEADQWFPRAHCIFEAGEPFLSVAGSPRFRVYETDFGFGRPKKVEVISIEDTGAISLAESRDDNGRGIEVGLALPECEMEQFASQFMKGLNN